MHTRMQNHNSPDVSLENGSLTDGSHVSVYTHKHTLKGRQCLSVVSPLKPVCSSVPWECLTLSVNDFMLVKTGSVIVGVCFYFYTFKDKKVSSQD